MPGGSPPSVVAIDLGAESCRVSLLQWSGDEPRIQLIQRYPNAPVARNGALMWNLDRILHEIEHGIRLCGESSASSIASIGVDGWAVDYVRIDANQRPIHPPYCYRDPRSEATMEELHRTCTRARLFALSGAQPLRINTIYQLMADTKAGVPPDVPWVNLPEYVLSQLGGRIAAEFTNATHTGLLDGTGRAWSDAVFSLSGLSVHAAPELVATGTILGQLSNTYAQAASLLGTLLIAPACHDTASAVAAIPFEGDNWAYISSGTWSLVGTLLDQPITTLEAWEAGFTNLGAAGDRICFHKNVNGMWLLKQTIEHLDPGGSMWTMTELIAAAERLPPPGALLDVDDAALLLPGPMAGRINEQNRARGVKPIEEHASKLPEFASLIFHSLAARYSVVLENAARVTGKRLQRIAIVGGGSLNRLLARLTAEATGLEVHCCVPESATIGNFAIQMATLEDQQNSRARIAHWARILTSLREC